MEGKGVSEQLNQLYLKYLPFFEESVHIYLLINGDTKQLPKQYPNDVQSHKKTLQFVPVPGVLQTVFYMTVSVDGNVTRT